MTDEGASMLNAATIRLRADFLGKLFTTRCTHRCLAFDSHVSFQRSYLPPSVPGIASGRFRRLPPLRSIDSFDYPSLTACVRVTGEGQRKLLAELRKQLYVEMYLYSMNMEACSLASFANGARYLRRTLDSAWSLVPPTNGYCDGQREHKPSVREKRPCNQKCVII